MISKKFIKSSFIYSVIGSLPMVSSFVLLPYYTNRLSTDDYGMLMIYILFSMLIQIIVNFGMDNYIPINYINTKDNKIKQSEIVATSTLLLLFIGVAFIIFFWFSGGYFFDFLNQTLYYGKNIIFSPWVFMSVITAFFNSYFKTYTNLLVYQQRPIKFLWMNVFNFVLTVSISIAGLYLFPNTLIGPMYGRLLSGLGIFFISFLFFYKEFGLKLKISYLKEIINYCYPFFLFLILAWVLGNIDRYIILYYLDKTSVGIFDFAVKCSLPVEFIQNGLMAAIIPIVFNLWKDKNINESTVEVNRYFNGFIAVFMIILPIYVLIIPLFVPLVVNRPEYYESFNYFPIIIVGFITRGLYVMYYFPILFLKKTKVLPIAFGMAAIIQIIISIIIIKYFGLIGAAYATVISKIVQLFFIYLFSRRYFKFHFNVNKLLVLPLIYLILVFVTEAFIPKTYWYFVQFGIIIIVSSTTFYIYWNELKLLANKYLPIKRNL